MGSATHMDMAGKIRTVLLDANFLLIPAQFKVDIFAELERICPFRFELCVLDAAVEELEKLAVDKSISGKDRKAAKLGLQLIRAKKVTVISREEDRQEGKSRKGGGLESGGRKVFKSADKAILEFAAAASRAAEKSVIVATQDKLLRDKLKAKGVPVIVLRQRQYLQLQ